MRQWISIDGSFRSPGANQDCVHLVVNRGGECRQRSTERVLLLKGISGDPGPCAGQLLVGREHAWRVKSPCPSPSVVRSSGTISGATMGRDESRRKSGSMPRGGWSHPTKVVYAWSIRSSISANRLRNRFLSLRGNSNPAERCCAHAAGSRFDVLSCGLSQRETMYGRIISLSSCSIRWQCQMGHADSCMVERVYGRLEPAVLAQLIAKATGSTSTHSQQTGTDSIEVGSHRTLILRCGRRL
jgi:hypothetical protein